MNEIKNINPFSYDKPIIYIGLADSISLPSAIEEHKQIKKYFQPLADEHLIEVKAESFIGTKDIINDSAKYSDREWLIFHFTGHGNPTSLSTDDGGIGSVTLATLFESQKDSLKLVFLNACCTYEQMHELREKGLKAAIIVTSDVINDRQATKFATNFYKYLIENDKNISSAFGFAYMNINSFIANGEIESHIYHYRAIGRISQETVSTPCPWGLHLIDEDKHSADKWRPSILEEKRKNLETEKENLEKEKANKEFRKWVKRIGIVLLAAFIGMSIMYIKTEEARKDEATARKGEATARKDKDKALGRMDSLYFTYALKRIGSIEGSIQRNFIESEVKNLLSEMKIIAQRNATITMYDSIFKKKTSHIDSLIDSLKHKK